MRHAGLVTLGPFAKNGGSGKTTSINGDPPVYVWLTGSTLFESIILNTLLPGYKPRIAAPVDQPSWRGDGRVDEKEVRVEIGYIESLTWLPRRVRLFPSEGGKCSLCNVLSKVLIYDMLFRQGRSRPKGASWWRDPFVAYGTGNDREPKAVVVKEDRVLWRDFAVLFLPSTAHIAAAVVEQTARLSEEGVFGDPKEFPVECFGIRIKAGQDKVFEWRWEQFPLSPRLVREPERAATVEAVLETAEQVASLLKQGLKRLYPRDGGGNRKAFERQIGAAQRSFSGRAGPLVPPTGSRSGRGGRRP